MTNTRAINAAAGVIHACIQQGKPLPVSIAFALEAAGLLNSFEHAAEVAQLSTDLDGARLSLWEEEQDSKRLRLALKSAQRGRREMRDLYEITEASRKRWRDALIEADEDRAALRARVAELEAEAGDGSTRTVDEDPIAYSLTPEALHASSGAVIEIPDRPRDGVYRQGTAHRQQMRDLIAGQRAALGNHDGPPHHDYTIGRDLPEVTP
jgi:hypothetical protein